MSRRHLAYAVLVVASFVVSACADVTSPVSEDIRCPDGSVIIMGSGAQCPT